MKFDYYDIESLNNVFTLANYKPYEGENGTIDLFYIIDNEQELTGINDMAGFTADVIKRTLEKNKNFKGTVKLYNLKEDESNRFLAKTFGLSDAVYTNDRNNESSYSEEYRLTCTTDRE